MVHPPASGSHSTACWWWPRGRNSCPRLGLLTNGRCHLWTHTHARMYTHINLGPETGIDCNMCMFSKGLLFFSVRMAVIDTRNRHLTLFFVLCLLLLTWNIVSTCCACHSFGTFFHYGTHPTSIYVPKRVECNMCRFSKLLLFFLL